VVLHPEWHPADRVAHYERHFVQALGQCAHVLAVSEFTRQEVIRTFGLAAERVTRTYLGVRPSLRPLPADQTRRTLRRLRLPANYLLYVGTLEPRKNILALLQMYCGLPGALRDRWPLVLVGGWGWNTTAIRDYLDSEARHRGVIHLGYVAEGDLNGLYNGARALLFPSLYEGFGLPPLEMMACGGAVLASTAGAVAETAGRQAHLVPADDVDGWRRAITRVVSDEDWWHALRREAAAVAHSFTWERCAAQTVQAYRTVCGDRSAAPSVRERAA
jgi:alpha-1,3-rhamnosyl/mannosyltransferase